MGNCGCFDFRVKKKFLNEKEINENIIKEPLILKPLNDLQQTRNEKNLNKKINLKKRIKNHNIKLLNETMNLNSSKLSLKDINDNKSNKKKRNKNLSFSPKPKNKIQLNKDIKKTNHNNHSVQINISNINNNNTINNNTFEKIVKEVNEDYDKNIEILKDQEEQIKFMLRLIKKI